MRFILIILALVTLTLAGCNRDSDTTARAANVDLSKMQTVSLSVPGMTCNLCPVTIRKALKKVPGVVTATAEFKAKTATITFDPTKTNVQVLMKATADAGYPSKVLTN